MVRNRTKSPNQLPRSEIDPAEVPIDLEESRSIAVADQYSCCAVSCNCDWEEESQPAVAVAIWRRSRGLWLRYGGGVTACGCDCDLPKTRG